MVRKSAILGKLINPSRGFSKMFGSKKIKSKGGGVLQKIVGIDVFGIFEKLDLRPNRGLSNHLIFRPLHYAYLVQLLVILFTEFTK